MSKRSVNFNQFRGAAPARAACRAGSAPARPGPAQPVEARVQLTLADHKMSASAAAAASASTMIQHQQQQQEEVPQQQQEQEQQL